MDDIFDPYASEKPKAKHEELIKNKDETRLAKEKELEQELVSSMDFKKLTNSIAEFIYSFTLRTGFYFTQDNPKYFGGVGYWLQADKQGRTMLLYNANPKNWNMNRVASDFENEERKFMENTYNLYRG
jgi:hypothetical protein